MNPNTSSAPAPAPEAPVPKQPDMPDKADAPDQAGQPGQVPDAAQNGDQQQKKDFKDYQFKSGEKALFSSEELDAMGVHGAERKEMQEQARWLERKFGQMAIVAANLDDNVNERAIENARLRMEKESRANKGIFQIIGTVIGAAVKPGQRASEAFSESLKGADGVKRGIGQIIKDTFKYSTPTKNITMRQYIAESKAAMKETGNIFAGDEGGMETTTETNKFGEEVEKTNLSEQAETANEAVAKRLAEAKRQNDEALLSESERENSQEASAETTANIKNALLELAKELNGKDLENPENQKAANEAMKKYREKVAEFRKELKGDDVNTTTDNLIDMGNQLTLLTDHNISEKVLEKYFDKKISMTIFSKAEVGTKTKEVVDTTTKALLYGAGAGGLAFAGTYAAKRAVRTGLKVAAVAALGASGGLAAAAVGGAVFGAMAAANRAKRNIANDQKSRAYGEGANAKFEKFEAGKMNAEDALSELSEFFTKNENGDLLNFKKNKIDIKEGDSDDVRAEKGELKRKLIDQLVEIEARTRLSDAMGVDLISYKGRNGMETSRMEMLVAMAKAKNALSEGERAAFDEMVQERIGAKNEGLTGDVNAMKRGQVTYKIMQTVKGGLIGAASGYLLAGGWKQVRDYVTNLGHGGEGAAAAANVASETGVDGEMHEAISEAKGGTILQADKDGGYEVWVDSNGNGEIDAGDIQLVGEGSAAGIEFNADGSIVENDAYAKLTEMGYQLNPNTITEEVPTFEHPTVSEIFNRENPDMTVVEHRSWVVDGNGRAMVDIDRSSIVRDTETGDIIMQVVPRGNSDVNVDDLQLYLTPDKAMTHAGLAFDVAADGTVRIPADSIAARDMFDADMNLRGGFGELIRETGTDGNVEVLSTPFSGTAALETVTVAGEPNVIEKIANYTLTTPDGQELSMNIPRVETANLDFYNYNNVEAMKDTGEPTGFNQINQVTEVRDVNGNTVNIDHNVRYGGYGETTDAYYGKVLESGEYLAKDNNVAAGTSVVKEMLFDDYKELRSQGLSDAQINAQLDQMFLEKVQNGEIDQGDAVEIWWRNVCSSAENVVGERARMGGLEARLFDTNGDGIINDLDDKQLIDTQDEINLLADQLSRDPEAYDAFVNSTTELFYEKAANSQLQFVDLSANPYQYSSWSWKNELGNIIEKFTRKTRACNGVGIVFTDPETGRSALYDEDVIRTMYQIPDSEDITQIGARLNCDQETVTIGKRVSEKTGNEKTGNEKTGNEKTSEKTESEKTSEKTGSEKTESEKTDVEKTETEKTSEKTESEKTSEKTESEKTGSEKTESEKTDVEITGKTDNTHAGDEVDLSTTPERQTGTDYVDATADNHVNPVDVAAGDQVTTQPTDNSAFDAGDASTASGSDTASSYSTDTSGWQGDADADAAAAAAANEARETAAAAGSSEANVEGRSTEDLANIFNDHQ